MTKWYLTTSAFFISFWIHLDTFMVNYDKFSSAVTLLPNKKRKKLRRKKKKVLFSVTGRSCKYSGICKSKSSLWLCIVMQDRWGLSFLSIPWKNRWSVVLPFQPPWAPPASAVWQIQCGLTDSRCSRVRWHDCIEKWSFWSNVTLCLLLDLLLAERLSLLLCDHVVYALWRR